MVPEQQWEGVGFVWLLQCHMCHLKSRRDLVCALPFFPSLILEDV